MKNSDSIAVVILAAGLGKRMNSPLPKVMIEADGKPIIDYVIEASQALTPTQTVIVTGHQRELVESHLAMQFQTLLSEGKLACALQEQQRGTGDATKAALPSLDKFVGQIVIICGDVPLIRTGTLEALLDLHQRESATVTLLSVRTLYPAQYGRILRGENSEVLGIKEFKDCSAQEKLINEINSGIYVVDSSFLTGALQQLRSNNSQGEFYLTDIVSQAVSEGQSVACLEHFDLSEVQGVNTRIDLIECNKLLRERRLHALIEAGVIINDPASVDIGRAVLIEAGAFIGAHSVISGKTVIKKNAVIDGFCIINDSTIAEGACVHHFVHADSAHIGPNSTVGPFARLRAGTILDGQNRIGNFVETKNARLAVEAKASHLTYLGDCSVGERANIGAGTITCNYDGYKKSVTNIGNDAFIGSNSALVAPVTIGDGSVVGAGSVITKDVEPGALALTRAEQVTIKGWVSKKRKG